MFVGAGEAKDRGGWFAKLTKIVFVAYGIFMPLLRLMEPTFFQIVKEMAVDRFTCKKKSTSDGSVVSSSLLEQAKKKEMTPMFFFLSSSLNVQLVYTILKGVTQFSYVDFSRYDEDSEVVHSKK